MITIEDFINAGYRKDVVPELERNWAQAFVQKCVYHDNKKAYYINVFFNKEFHNMVVRPTISLQFEVPIGIMNLEFFSFKSDTTIPKMEDYIDYLWHNILANFYDEE
jgi:hypothetical protein